MKKKNRYLKSLCSLKSFLGKTDIFRNNSVLSEENMNAAQRQRIIRSGWLKKQGGMVRTWHRRWFCLNNDFLFYFAKEDDSKPLGCIFLPGNRVCEVPFNPEEPDKCLLEISAGKKKKQILLNCCLLAFIQCKLSIFLILDVNHVRNFFWNTQFLQLTY